MPHFSWSIDGSIIGFYLLVTMAAGVWLRKRVRRVEDFLVAGREMNLHLGIASLAATEFGVITCMYAAQAGYTQGFAGAFPGLCQAGGMFFVGWTGFCVKRLRDKGVMTLPELFENRFGQRVRWLSGVVIVMGGLLNMGVFLKIGGQFLVLVTGLDLSYLVLIMTILLGLVAIYTMLGGMLSVLVTDFLQFVVMSVGLLVVTVMVLVYVGWDQLVTTVETYHGTGGFLPFANPHTGWAFVTMQILMGISTTLTWQTVISRLLSAKDSKTGQQVFTRTSFFFVCRWIIPGLWGIAALAMLGWKPLDALSATDRAALPQEVAQKIEASPVGIPLDGLSLEEQAAIPAKVKASLNDTSLNAMPKWMSTFLPIGLMGLLLAAMLAADMSTDASYMLSWGSVIYNDILAPFRRKPWPHARAILWNRCIIALIGVYLFVFGLWYNMEGNVWSYLALTGSIYLSSMSALLIACCYWPRANNWGAFSAIVLGALVPVVHLVMEQSDSLKPLLHGFNKDHAGIAAFVASALGMVIGSLLKPKSSSVTSTPAQA